MTTPDEAMLWADKHAPYGTARHYGVVGYRAGHAARDAEATAFAERVAVLEKALRDQIDGCSMIVRMLSGQETRVAHLLREMLNAQIDHATAALGDAS